MRRMIYPALTLAGLIAASPAAAAPSAAHLGLPPLPASSLAPATAAARADLGRSLFFERRLSINGTLSCAMCHIPEQAFTANEVRTSVGMEGVSLRRNAPTLLNVAYVTALFHDGRAATLEEQALMPITHPDEMANPDMATVVARVAAWPEYRPRFRRAYGDPRPSAARIASALADYERTLLAADSRFDRWRYGGRNDAVTDQERRGFDLFIEQGCSSCHTVGERDALFTDQAFHNTGVQAHSDAARSRDVRVQLGPGLATVLTPDDIRRVGVADAPDSGRQEVTRQAADARAFRTPSLRNVALTAPYMHDGSFDTLEAVVDYYIAGGTPADAAQDARIRPLPVDRAGRDALVAFLRSLTADSLTQATPRSPATAAPAPR